MAADPTEAVEFLRQANDAESQNRQLALTDLKFRYGDQWPQYAVASRGLDRPQLTINETDSYIRQVTANQRQQRPRGKAHPVDNNADPKIAKVITGIGRHIEVNSDADNAYDTAFDFAATMGWGYWRICTDYIREDSFDQDIFIRTITNPFSVYFDYDSLEPDGSDAQKALVTELMKKEAFKKMYPDADDFRGGFSERGTGDSDPDWATEHEVRIAEYFYVSRKKARLVKIVGGPAVWEDELPRMQQMAERAGVPLMIEGDRESFKREVLWCKQTSQEILEERVLPFRWIPIVPVYWTRVRIESEWLVQGLVRPAMDPARMVNFWNTAATEMIALAPKAKWLIAEGQDEGHEQEFQHANTSTAPVLRFKQTDVNGSPAPSPQRIAPEPPPDGIMASAAIQSQNLAKVMGIFDPATRSGAQHKSDKTLMAERNQSENTNYHGYDNLTRSIRHTWRVMLSAFPAVYDVQRVQRIIGDDGKDSLVTLNERVGEEAATQKILNDVTVGTYDVVMETGPGYDTKRQQGVADMIQVMATPVGEAVATVGADLLIRQMDFNGADVLADRLAAANPLAKIDENSDVPPQVQMQLASLKQMNQELQQQLQAAGVEIKFRRGIEQMKQEGATQRELMKSTTAAHRTEQENLSLQHSVEVKALTAQNVEEIRGLVKLLSDKIGAVNDRDIAVFETEVARRDREQERKAEEVASQQPA